MGWQWVGQGLMPDEPRLQASSEQQAATETSEQGGTTQPTPCTRAGEIQIQMPEDPHDDHPSCLYSTFLLEVQILDLPLPGRVTLGLGFLSCDMTKITRPAFERGRALTAQMVMMI